MKSRCGAYALELSQIGGEEVALCILKNVKLVDVGDVCLEEFELRRYSSERQPRRLSAPCIFKE